MAKNEHEEVVLEKDSHGNIPTILFVSTIDEWYSNIAYFIIYGECPTHLTYKEKRNLNMKSANYVLWENSFYKRSLDGTFLGWIDKTQQAKLLESFHNLVCGGNFLALLTTHKILWDRYYWPTLFQDAND